MFIVGRNLIMKNEVVSNSTLLCDLNNKHTHEVKINTFQEYKISSLQIQLRSCLRRILMLVF